MILEEDFNNTLNYKCIQTILLIIGLITVLYNFLYYYDTL